MTNNNVFDIAINDISPAQMQTLLNQTFHLENGQAITLVEVQTNQSQQTPYSWQQKQRKHRAIKLFFYRFPFSFRPKLPTRHIPVFTPRGRSI
jgi:hypothetical protein